MAGMFDDLIPQKQGLSFDDLVPQNGQPAAPKPNLAETIAEQGLQGVTFGFADEGIDRLSALMAMPFTGQSYGDMLGRAREMTTERLNRQMAERPGVSIASNIAGGLATGVAGAATKAGATVGRVLRTGNAASRVAKGAATGAATGALYGAGSGQEGNRAGSALSGAVSGGLIGGAVPAAGAALNKLNTKTVIPNSEAIREQGGKLFRQADELGGTLKPEVANEFYRKIYTTIRPQTEAGDIFRGETPTSKIIDKIPKLFGQPMSLQAAKEVDEALGDLAYGTMDNFGKFTAEGKKLLDMQSALRRTIDMADESMIEGGKAGFDALKKARKAWSTSLKMRDIERIMENAQRMEQPSSSLRAGFRTLLRNADRLKGYSPAEVKALKKAAETGVVTDLFRLMGSGLVPIGSGIAGTAAGGPMGGLVSAAGAAAVQQGSKAVANARQMGRAQGVVKAISDSAGMTQSVDRVQLPNILRQILLMPPAQAKAALEAIPTQQRAEAIKLLPSPTSARPMTPDQIRAAQASLNRTYVPNGEELDKIVVTSPSMRMQASPDQLPPKALPAPGKASALPMDDLQVRRAQASIDRGEKSSSVQLDGGAIKPPVDQMVNVSEKVGRSRRSELLGMADLLKSGQMSTNEFVRESMQRFGLTQAQARNLAQNAKRK